MNKFRERDEDLLLTHTQTHTQTHTTKLVTMATNNITSNTNNSHIIGMSSSNANLLVSGEKKYLKLHTFLCAE